MHWVQTYFTGRNIKVLCSCYNYKEFNVCYDTLPVLIYFCWTLSVGQKCTAAITRWLIQVKHKADTVTKWAISLVYSPLVVHQLLLHVTHWTFSAGTFRTKDLIQEHAEADHILNLITINKIEVWNGFLNQTFNIDCNVSQVINPVVLRL